jgi:hypothetical protein
MLGALLTNAAEIPTIAKSASGEQLIVDGKPYLIPGGELGNSSAGTAAQADTILPRIAQLHVQEFYIAGMGLNVSFFRNPDVDTQVGRIERVEEVSRSNGDWVTLRLLSGDQTNQGRQLSMAAHQIHLYRVVLYATARVAEKN